MTDQNFAVSKILACPLIKFNSPPVHQFQVVVQLSGQFRFPRIIKGTLELGITTLHPDPQLQHIKKHIRLAQLTSDTQILFPGLRVAYLLLSSITLGEIESLSFSWVPLDSELFPADEDDEISLKYIKISPVVYSDSGKRSQLSRFYCGFYDGIRAKETIQFKPTISCH